MLRQVYYALPPNLRFLARRLYYAPTDMLDRLRGKRDDLTPPKGLIFTGSGDFKAQGQKLLGYFQEIGGLQPDHQVLDIGSGIGRIAVPLTTFLNTEGGYEGFDVVELGVKWCQNRISTRFPNFNFRYIPLDNDLYKSGGNNAANFQFPYSDQSFDFVILTSVFTHMLPDEVANYLKEIRRVLKPNGTCFATFFIWNEKSAQLSASNPAFQFPYDYGGYRLMDEVVKSANVAYEETELQRLVASAKLTTQQCHYGFWCGRPKEQCKDFQDILILKK